MAYARRKRNEARNESEERQRGERGGGRERGEQGPGEAEARCGATQHEPGRGGAGRRESGRLGSRAPAEATECDRALPVRVVEPPRARPSRAHPPPRLAPASVRGRAARPGPARPGHEKAGKKSGPDSRPPHAPLPVPVSPLAPPPPPPPAPVGSLVAAAQTARLRPRWQPGGARAEGRGGGGEESGALCVTGWGGERDPRKGGAGAGEGEGNAASVAVQARAPARARPFLALAFDRRPAPAAPATSRASVARAPKPRRVDRPERREGGSARCPGLPHKPRPGPSGRVIGIATARFPRPQNLAVLSTESAWTESRNSCQSETHRNRSMNDGVLPLQANARSDRLTRVGRITSNRQSCRSRVRE